MVYNPQSQSVLLPGLEAVFGEIGEALFVMNFVDRAALVGGVKITADGFLVAEVAAVRTGIQRYAGFELGIFEMPFIDVYRPAEEVFSAKTLQSFSHVPVTIDHPPVMVTSENWKDFAVGEVSAEVLRDGERMKIPLVLKDADAIALVRDGKRQLSAGYTCELVFEDGITPDGKTYQAIQRGIVANHLAVVDHGRAGPDFRIGDQWGVSPCDLEDHKMNLRSVVIDGITIQTTDQGAEALNKQGEKIVSLTAQLSANRVANEALVAAKDAEIGELKVKLADAEKRIPDPAAMDAAVVARSELVANATKLVKDFKPEGKTEETIRREVVIAVYGADMAKDISDAEVSGMFRAAVSLNKDSVGDALRRRSSSTSGGGGPTSQDPFAVSDSQREYEKRLTEAYKKTA